MVAPGALLTGRDRCRTQADHPRSIFCSPWTTSTRTQRPSCVRIHLAERQRERFRGQSETPVASQVNNHRTISRAQVGSRAPAAKNSTVTEDWSTADSPTREKEKLEQQVRQSCSHCRDCRVIPADFVLRPAPYLTETMVEPSLPSSRVGAAAVPDSNFYCSR